MKMYAALIMAMLLLLTSGAAAQQEMRLYVQEGSIDEAQAKRLLGLLEEEEACWTLMDDERTLRELVLGGEAPDLAICPPAVALPWAKEGLLVPLHTHIGGQQRMQRQVLDLCVYDEAMFMAPLMASHRRLAVNQGLMEEAGLSYMLDSQAYPVWHPAQFYQIMEEFLLRDCTTLDIWRAQMESSAPLEALTQAIYGGMLLSEDGKTCTADSMHMRAGVQWLADAVEDGMIGYCRTQEDALARFLAGETAIYIDWTDALEKRLGQALQEAGMEIAVRPYPAAAELPVRSFELIGVCAFSGGDAAREARLMRACAKLHEAAQDVLGPRGIWHDGAIWPASLSSGTDATLRSLFCTALQDVIEGGESAQTAMHRLQAAMDALERTK